MNYFNLQSENKSTVEQSHKVSSSKWFYYYSKTMMAIFLGSV